MGKIKYIVKENKLLAFATFTLVVLELLLIFWQNKYISEQINVMKEQNAFIVKQNTFIEQQTKIMNEQNDINRNVLQEMAIQNKFIKQQSQLELERFSQQKKEYNKTLKKDKILCLESFLNNPNGKIDKFRENNEVHYFKEKYKINRNEIQKALNNLKKRGTTSYFYADEMFNDCGL